MRTRTHVPVSRRALVQRINRALTKEGEQLHVSRGEAATRELGAYYILDTSRNLVTSKELDLEDVGRALGVLRPFERLAH